jgi:ArsR family transcriptional regulator
VTTARATDLARAFKALGDPTRLAIFELVRARVDPAEGRSPGEIENSISQIASRFDLSLSTVSHHIKELRQAGLIRCDRRGQSIYCTVDPEVLEDLGRFLETR